MTPDKKELILELRNHGFTVDLPELNVDDEAGVDQTDFHLDSIFSLNTEVSIKEGRRHIKVNKF